MFMTELEAPVETAVPVADFAQHLQMGSGFAEDADLNALLETYLRAATSAVEAATGKALISRRLKWRVTCWRTPTRQVIPVAPVVQVEQLDLVDREGASSVVEPDLYRLVADDLSPELTGSAGGFLPSIPIGGHVDVTFTAGYGALPSDIPADLRHAVTLLATRYFEDRDSSRTNQTAMPFAVLALLEPYRRFRIWARV